MVSVNHSSQVTWLVVSSLFWYFVFVSSVCWKLDELLFFVLRRPSLSQIRAETRMFCRGASVLERRAPSTWKNTWRRPMCLAAATYLTSTRPLTWAAGPMVTAAVRRTPCQGVPVNRTAQLWSVTRQQTVADLTGAPGLIRFSALPDGQWSRDRIQNRCVRMTKAYPEPPKAGGSPSQACLSKFRPPRPRAWEV